MVVVMMKAVGRERRSRNRQTRHYKPSNFLAGELLQDLFLATGSKHFTPTIFICSDLHSGKFFSSWKYLGTGKAKALQSSRTARPSDTHKYGSIES